MFPYDATLLAAVQAVPQSIPDVMQTLATIDATCIDGDGLKWFNRVYWQVTQAVEARVAAGDFVDPPWLAQLDVQFARLYFSALQSSLSGQSAPACWQALFDCRNQTALARIQFALAGINAHIDHDLPAAIVATCQVTSVAPADDSAQYDDYTSVNSTLDTLIESAKQTLNVRLLGDALPPVTHLEDTLAAFDIVVARETAWENAVCLWQFAGNQLLESTFMSTLDGLTCGIGKALLIPVP